jgi:topoisomerase IV subunit A
MTSLEPLMERNFLEYASYVIVDRAIPDIRDGLKPVQRRILTTLFDVDDGKFHKVANVIGETMKLHPHGDASIGDALVVLSNKEYFIEKQGNFGNVITGHSAAAPRYIECRLSELARETLFYKALTTYRPSYDGRKEEPIFLPAKLPVALMLGTEGIAVGMSTKILPHNLIELLKGQIDVLRHKPVRLDPDFLSGGIVDVTEYDDGRGKVKVRARIEQVDDKTIVVREIPYSTTTEGLINSIESAAQKGRVKIASIDDFTTDKVEIEIGLPRGVHSDEVIPQLYAYTDCEVSITSNILVIDNRHPVEMSVSEAMLFLSNQLRDQVGAELEFRLSELHDQHHWLTLERIFIEGAIYKRIEKAKTKEEVKLEVYEGLKPFFKVLDRAVDDNDIRRLLEIPIRRISIYDIKKNKRDIEDVELEITKVEAKFKELTRTTIKYLTDLIKKYGKQYPRRTEISTFEAVDVRAVARQNIRAMYDSDTGFFGSEVKTGDIQFTMSEYDRILVVCKDGTFRIVGPTDKVLFPDKVLYMEDFDEEEGKTFTVVYRDEKRVSYGKRVHILKFIRDREYELIKGKEGKIDMLLPGDAMGQIHLKYVPAKRQRVREAEFDLQELDFIGVGARGRRLAPKPVARVKHIKLSPEEIEEQGIVVPQPRPKPNPADAPITKPRPSLKAKPAPKPSPRAKPAPKPKPQPSPRAKSAPKAKGSNKKTKQIKLF